MTYQSPLSMAPRAGANWTCIGSCSTAGGHGWSVSCAGQRSYRGALPRRTFIDVFGIEDFLDFTEIVAAVFVLLFEHGQKADLPVHRCKVTSQLALTKIIVQQQACTLFACVT